MRGNTIVERKHNHKTLTTSKFNINTKNDDVWLTPPELIKAMGEFDLDPCSPVNRPWDTAKEHYTIDDNGLLLPWHGRVWLNPPYGRVLDRWMQKMSVHNNGIALVFARTETRTFHAHIFPSADSIMFIDGRITFHHGDGTRARFNGGAPSVLIGYNEQNSDAIAASGIKGCHVYLKPCVYFLALEKDARTWRVIVGQALVDLNGNASVSEIYDAVVKIAPKRIHKNQNYKAKVRQILQYHYTRISKGNWSDTGS
jgi:hypothetical protein